MSPGLGGARDVETNRPAARCHPAGRWLYCRYQRLLLRGLTQSRIRSQHSCAEGRSTTAYVVLLKSYSRVLIRGVKTMLPIPESGTHSGACVELLYEHYQRPLLAYLTRLVSDREAAEDLCQETFIKALRGGCRRDQSASVAAWLYRIATNTAYDHLRRRRRIRFTVLMEADQPPSGEHSMESRLDEQEPVHMALEQIPAMYRLPLVL